MSHLILAFFFDVRLSGTFLFVCLMQLIHSDFDLCRGQSSSLLNIVERILIQRLGDSESVAGKHSLQMIALWFLLTYYTVTQLFGIKGVHLNLPDICTQFLGDDTKISFSRLYYPLYV